MRLLAKHSCRRGEVSEERAVRALGLFSGVETRRVDPKNARPDGGADAIYSLTP